MDILLLFEYPTLCGGEQSMLCLLPHLKAADCQFRAAAPAEGALATALHAAGVEVVPLALHDASGTRRPLEECRAELGKMLVRQRPDVLHANSLSMARLSGPVAADLGLASAGHLRDIIRLSRRAVEDINRHPLLLAVSKAVATFHREQGVDPSRIDVLYNGVDLSHFQPRPATGYLHGELGLPPDARLLATIGQISQRKGLDQLLLAMRLVLESWTEAHLLIIGQRFSNKLESIELEQSLHKAAEALPLRGHVHFLGWRDDIARVLPELTFLVHMARQEPLGRVLLEAAASGCPIIATDVGGTAEIFSPTESTSRSAAGAILVSPDDPRAMADAIVSLALEPARMATLRHAARLCVESGCNLEMVATRLVKHWEVLAR